MPGAVRMPNTRVPAGENNNDIGGSSGEEYYWAELGGVVDNPLHNSSNDGRTNRTCIFFCFFCVRYNDEICILFKTKFVWDFG